MNIHIYCLPKVVSWAPCLYYNFDEDTNIDLADDHDAEHLYTIFGSFRVPVPGSRTPGTSGKLSGAGTTLTTPQHWHLLSSNLKLIRTSEFMKLIGLGAGPYNACTIVMTQYSVLRPHTNNSVGVRAITCITCCHYM